MRILLSARTRFAAVHAATMPRGPTDPVGRTLQRNLNLATLLGARTMTAKRLIAILLLVVSVAAAVTLWIIESNRTTAIACGSCIPSMVVVGGLFAVGAAHSIASGQLKTAMYVSCLSAAMSFYAIYSALVHPRGVFF